MEEKQAILLDLMEEVKQLTNLVNEKDKTIEGLEKRIYKNGGLNYKRIGNNTRNVGQYCGQKQIGHGHFSVYEKR